MAEYSSQGSKLEICTTAEGTYQKLYGLMNIPDMGGDPAKIDITNLADTNKRSIPGLKDYGDPEFEFYYNKETPDAGGATELKNTYYALTAYEASSTELFFKITYPDETGFTFKGRVTVKRSGAGVDEALKFKLKVTISGTVAPFKAPATGLIVTSIAGTTTGNTKITVLPTLAEENSYKYKTASSVIAPEELSLCTTGYTDWNGTADITATTGNKILIVEVDENDLAIMAGIATATSKA